MPILATSRLFSRGTGSGRSTASLLPSCLSGAVSNLDLLDQMSALSRLLALVAAARPGRCMVRDGRG